MKSPTLALIVCAIFFSVGIFLARPQSSFTNFAYEAEPKSFTEGTIAVKLLGKDSQLSPSETQRSSPYYFAIFTRFDTKPDLKNCRVSLNSAKFTSKNNPDFTTALPAQQNQIPELGYTKNYEATFVFENLPLSYDNYDLTTEIKLSNCPETTTIKETFSLQKKIEKTTISFWDKLMGI